LEERSLHSAELLSEHKGCASASEVPQGRIELVVDVGYHTFPHTAEGEAAVQVIECSREPGIYSRLKW